MRRRRVWIAAVMATAVATAASAASASARRVPCTKVSHGRYECSFYPAGNGISAGAPVQTAHGTRVGYLNQGRNWIICQASGATVHYHGYYNRWWGYTEANDHHMGWVNAVYASGGSNNGPFAAIVPNCGSTYGSPPTSTRRPPPPPAHNYNTVALGDSYSSGLGNATYYDKAPCWRSYGAYAWRLVWNLNLTITDFEACAAATTSSVLYDQVEGYHIGGLSVSTGVVTLSVGGNDADFIGVIGRCLISKSWCENQLRKERRVIRDQLPGRLDTLYQVIKHEAPHAKVIVLGYPYLFGRCGKAGGVSLLHGATDLLDNTIHAATRRNHVYFVDTRAAFTGHSECDKNAWINHFYGGEPWVSFHPNDAGWEEDANLIEQELWRIGW